MLEELKERVCKANKQLKESGLVILTWGNVSAIDRNSNLIVIKPSGVDYDELTPDKMVVVNMDGRVIEGNLNPSSDTPTHIALYQAFDEIGGIVHTHSRYATIWAQAGLDIVAYGTTHADYFYGDVPCTMPLEEDQIENDYEKNTGYVIADTFARRRIGCMEIPACLVAHHGPFTWGTTPEKAVENAIVLEEVAHMAVFNTNFQFGLTRIQDALLDKHYLRKHGENAYYGQTVGSVTALDPASGEKIKVPDEEIEIAPNKVTVELKNTSEIASVERPVINKPPKKEEEVFKFDDSIAPDAGSDMSGDMGGVDDIMDDFEASLMAPEDMGEPLIPNEPDLPGEPIPAAEPEPAYISVSEPERAPAPAPKPELDFGDIELMLRPAEVSNKPTEHRPWASPVPDGPLNRPAESNEMQSLPDSIVTASQDRSTPPPQPAAPVQPAASVQPAAPAQPTAPAQPAAPVQPTAPAQSAAPSGLKPLPTLKMPAMPSLGNRPQAPAAPAAPQAPTAPAPEEPLDFTF